MDPQGQLPEGKDEAHDLGGALGDEVKGKKVEVEAGERREGEDQQGMHVNLERGLIVHGDVGGDSSEEDGEEFVLDEGDVEEESRVQWLAVARFYSARIVKARAMFAELSNAWGEVCFREIGDNRFLLEFASENSLNIALSGGPWKFRGDALIVVRYDGLSRLSDVVIDSIPLWIRIYDIPVKLMRPDFVTALGKKVGKVLEIGAAIRDFMRVRVSLDLADALKASVKIKVQGKGPMVFAVKYEDVPYFCFWCGRIGHSDRECPEEDLNAEEMRYGVELRTSPFKQVMGRQLAVFKAAPAVKRGLNFSGAQKEKVASFTGSSNHRARGDGRFAGRARSSFTEGGTAGGQSSLPEEAEEVLSRQVEDMVVDETMPANTGVEVAGPKWSGERVSGLNSFMGSSEEFRGSHSNGALPVVSMHERQQLAKRSGNDLAQRKGLAKNPCAVGEIQKVKKSKKVHSPKVLVETLNTLGVGVSNGNLGLGAMSDGSLLAGREGRLKEEAIFSDVPMVDPTSTAATNLVGAHGEPHQEQ